MKILATVAAALVVLVPQAAAKPGHDGVLAVVAQGQTQLLERLDPLSLERSGPAIRVGRDSARVVARSPDGGSVVVVNYEGGSLKIVSLAGGIVTRSAYIRGGDVGGLWTRPTRLVLLNDGDYAGFSVVTLGKRIRSVWHPLAGNAIAWTQTPTALVAVLAPVDAIGPARLAVVDGSGVVRTAALPGIQAGFTIGAGNDPEVRMQVPALAADPTGTRVVVASANGGLATVNLGTLAVESHGGRSLAKNISGAALNAVWLTADVVALSGVDVAHDESAPRGLTLLDTRDWSSRGVDERTSWLLAAGGMLLACGRGLSGYGPDGRLAFHALGDADLPVVSAAGQLVYATRDGRSFTIVNPATGDVAGQATTPYETTIVGTW